MSEKYAFKTREEFHQWLLSNYMQDDGIWIIFDKTIKKNVLKASEALEEALCFGWVDGQMKSIDQNSYMKYFVKRRNNSKWSEKNKKLAIELEEKGCMQDAGKIKIIEAMQSGQWDINNTLEVLDSDLNKLLDVLKDNELAYTNFLAMSPSIKKTYTKAFMDPKTEAGKQKRIAWIIDRLNQNLKPM